MSPTGKSNSTLVANNEPDNAELEALLARCARQDAGALEALYQRAAPLLLGVLMRMLRSRDTAEDVLQDVFVSIWRQAGNYEARRGRVMAWLVSIARYRAIDIYRGQKRLVSFDSQSDQTQMEWQHDDALQAEVGESSLTVTALDGCMRQLTIEQQRCMTLAYQHGLTHDDIALQIGSPLGTVKSWMRRGLQSLRRCLES